MRWLPLFLLTACTDLPWGAGGTEVVPATRAALTRVLGEGELSLGARRLASEVSNRVGRSLALTDLTLPIAQGYEAALGAVSATLGPLQLAIAEDSGLRLSLELAIAPQPLWGLPAACEASIALPAGELSVTFDLTNDKLGRVLPVPRGPASWKGTPPELVITGCALADLQVPDLGARLVKSAWSALKDPLHQSLPAALGLDLALSSSSVVGLDALGAGILRASLRVAPSPSSVEAGLAVVFDLGLDAEAHPCAPSPLDSPAPPPTAEDSPALAGTSLSLAAAERLLHAAWATGSVCGASLWRNIPEQLREIPLADIASPAVDELRGLDGSATASASFWPRALPSLAPEGALTDTIRIDVPRIEADVTAILDGARWRLFTLELDLSIHGQLAADADGFVHFDPVDVDATLRSSSPGLIAVPSDGPAQIIEPILRALLESRPLFRLPASLTPKRTTVWRVSPSHLTLQSEW